MNRQMKENNMKYFLITFKYSDKTKCALEELIKNTDKHFPNVIIERKFDNIFILKNNNDVLSEAVLSDFYRKELMKDMEFIQDYYGSFLLFVKEINDSFELF